MPLGADRTGGIAGALGQMADGLGRLVSEHFTLAKLELARDAQAVGTELGKMLLFAPLVIVGYAFLCGALSLGLTRWVPLPWALVIVGAVNLAVGAAGLAGAAGRLRAQQPLQSTLREVSQSAALMAPATNGANVEVKHGA